MAMKEENKYKARICEELRRAGAVILNVHGHMMQAAGWPDTQVYSHVWCGHIEFKAADGKCSALQRKHIGDLLLRGFPALVIRKILDAEIVELSTGVSVADFAALRKQLGILKALKRAGELTFEKLESRARRAPAQEAPVNGVEDLR